MTLAHETLPLAQELTIFLFCAGLIVPFAKRFNINPVIGFLTLGLLLGPYGLGRLADQLPLLNYFTIADSKDVAILAEWGVIFLMFSIGLELSLNRLWSMRRLVFGFGSGQIIVSALVIGGIAYYWGNSASISIVLGGCLALSSTAIVVQLLAQKNQISSSYGQTNIAVLLMQDLAVVPILFLVTFYGEQHLAQHLAENTDQVSQPLWLSVFISLGQGFGILLIIYGVGRKILCPLLHMVAGSKSPELFVASSLLIIVVTANLTGMAGLSMALGAFLAGLLLSETEFRHAIDVDMEPFKGLLLGLFFLTVGMGIDPSIMVEKGGWLLASVIGLLLIKTLVTTGLALVFHIPFHQALPVGLMLSQGGEFAFVVVGLAMSYQLLPDEVGHFMLMVASITMMLTPPLAKLADYLQQLLKNNQAPHQAPHDTHQIMPQDLKDHIIIAGFGRVGRILCRSLSAESAVFMAIEKDIQRMADARNQDMPVYFGDACRLEILKRAGADQARLLVITMDDGPNAEALVATAKKHWPHLYILARAKDIAHAQRLMAVGADDVILEIVEASLQLSAVILEFMGLPHDQIRSKMNKIRTEENLQGQKNV